SRRVSTDQARTVCVYKSAKYTTERPLHIGAALAGRLDEMAAPLSAFGLPLGEAFQLRDDLLGAFGDGAKLGKEVGEDIRAGKPTALYATAVAHAAGADRALLEQRYGEPDLGADEIGAIQHVLDATGARADIEA